MCVRVRRRREPEHVRVNIVNHEIWPPQCDCRVCKKKPSAPIHMSIRKSCVTHTCAYTRFSTCSRKPGFLFFFSALFRCGQRCYPRDIARMLLPGRCQLAHPVDGLSPARNPAQSAWCPVPGTHAQSPPVQFTPSSPVAGLPPNGPVSCLCSLPHRLSLPISSITLCGLHIYTSALFCLQKRFHYITKNNQ